VTSDNQATSDEVIPSDAATQPFTIVLTYRVQARDRGEAMKLLVKYQSDAQFMIEQDLRKHRGSQVVDLLDCDVHPGRPQP
jgi:hypothetical protein